MEALDLIEGGAHMAIGIVDHPGAAFDRRGTVLDQLHRLGRVPLDEQGPQTADRLVDGARIVIGLGIGDEATWVDGVVDRVAEGFEIDSAAAADHPQPQPVE